MVPLKSLPLDVYTFWHLKNKFVLFHYFLLQFLDFICHVFLTATNYTSDVHLFSSTHPVRFMTLDVEKQMYYEISDINSFIQMLYASIGLQKSQMYLPAVYERDEYIYFTSQDFHLCPHQFFLF